MSPARSPNRTHAAPLSFGSCNPPAQTSGFATVGTPDANSQPAKSVGSLKLKAIGEVPINTGNGNQSDLEIDLSFTDVRQKRNARQRLHRRPARPDEPPDHRPQQHPHPGGPGPGTVVPLSFEFDVPCATTADTTSAAPAPSTRPPTRWSPARCSSSSARSGSWARSTVYDGGTDGNPTTEGDNTLFATQGVFIP